MDIFRIVCIIVYAIGFVFAAYRSAQHIMYSYISDDNWCATFAMVLGVALTWPLIMLKDVVRVFVLKQRNRGWDK